MMFARMAVDLGLGGCDDGDAAPAARGHNRLGASVAAIGAQVGRCSTCYTGRGGCAAAVIRGGSSTWPIAQVCGKWPCACHFCKSLLAAALRAGHSWRAISGCVEGA